jgi:hypothetical protein
MNNDRHEMDAAQALDNLNATAAALAFLSEALDQMDPVKPMHGPGIGHILDLCATRIETCETVLKGFWARNCAHDRRMKGASHA